MHVYLYVYLLSIFIQIYLNLSNLIQITYLTVTLLETFVSNFVYWLISKTIKPQTTN